MAKLKPTPAAPSQETVTSDASTGTGTGNPTSLFGVDGTTGQPSSAGSATDTGTGAAPAKSPTLVWTEPRRLALVTAYANGNHTTASIARALASDPAFDGYPADEITPAKVRSQVLKLRKAAEKEGVTFPLPPLDREPGSGRPHGSTKPINWGALNAVLQSAGAGSTSEGGTSNVA